MASKTDAELIAVAESAEGSYRPEALQAALDELKKRNVALRPAEQVQKERAEVAASNATAPLEPGWFLAVILMPLCFFPWLVVASSFERRGYLEKARSLRKIVWVYMGIVIATLLAGFVAAKFARH